MAEGAGASVSPEALGVPGAGDVVHPAKTRALAVRSAAHAATPVRRLSRAVEGAGETEVAPDRAELLENTLGRENTEYRLRTAELQTGFGKDGMVKAAQNPYAEISELNPARVT